MPFTIATLNLCNFGSDASADRVARLAHVIATHLQQPDIVAVQEVKADCAGDVAEGPVSAQESYLTLIRAVVAAGGPAYAFREVAPMAHQDGGQENAHIRVGLLFNPARVHCPDRGQAGPNDATGLIVIDGQPHLYLNPGRVAPTHPAFVGDAAQQWAPSRKALAVECTVSGRTVFVIVCHFKSMRALTRRNEEDAKKQRQAQAVVIHDFVANLLAYDPNAAVVVLGDFNDLPCSKTLNLLKGTLLYNLCDDVPRGEHYTRRHSGRPQALDHVLVSAALRPGAQVRIPHLHSDAPRNRGEPASDHDPVWVQLGLV